MKPNQFIRENKFCFSLVLVFALSLSYFQAYSASPPDDQTWAIFRDDFEDFKEDDWEIFIGPPSTYGSSWKILEDQGNKVFSMKGSISPLTGSFDWKDFTLIVRVKFIDMKEGMRITVRTNEQGAGYEIELTQYEFSFIKSLGWETEPIYLTKTTSLLESDKWYAVKIVCQGNTIWVYIDDELKYEYHDDDPVLSGRFNIGC